MKSKDILPVHTADLLTWLETRYSAAHALPHPQANDREIWMRVGEHRLVVTLRQMWEATQKELLNQKTRVR